MSKKVEVMSLFEENVKLSDKKYKSTLLVSDKVIEFINYSSQTGEKKVFEKAKRILENKFKHGIVNYKNKEPIRYEWGNIYRIRYAENYRLIGFFQNNFTTFVAIDCFKKTKQSLTNKQSRVIDDVAEILKKNRWEREYHDEEKD